MVLYLVRLEMCDIRRTSLVRLESLVGKLEEAGYIAINNTFIGTTAKGRKIFQKHMAALESILKRK